MLLKLITAPISLIYAFVIGVRNKLFDKGILRSEEFDIPIVCVGNLTVGGTGKTPLVEFMIENLSDNFKIAVVSRGYKRKSKGFIRLTQDSHHRQVGDESKQLKMKYPHIEVAVCEKRAKGIKAIRSLCPEVDLILLDDAFQHRRVEPWVSVLLMDYNRPVYEDNMLPLGRLRDSLSQIHRAGLVITTKCPSDIQPVDMRSVIHKLDLFPYQKAFFTSLHYAALRPQFADVVRVVPKEQSPIIVMTGIANAEPMIEHLSKSYDIIKRLDYPDHYTYRVNDMKKLSRILESSPKNALIVITEKDAAKLTNRDKIPVDIQQRLYVLPIKVLFFANSKNEFLKHLEKYVRKNQKYSDLHS